jgi:DNA invertase Pin-like site-specific DNA recombinase
MRDQRVTSHHLSRDAYLYIRQSTPRQIIENAESTRRQYALRERAIALGWPAQRIHTIDQDLGMSAAYSVARDGFQELVAAVGLRKVGIVLGLEVSRLARNCVDWQQLLQLF